MVVCEDGAAVVVGQQVAASNFSWFLEQKVGHDAMTYGHVCMLPRNLGNQKQMYQVTKKAKTIEARDHDFLVFVGGTFLFLSHTRTYITWGFVLFPPDTTSKGSILLGRL